MYPVLFPKTVAGLWTKQEVKYKMSLTEPSDDHFAWLQWRKGLVNVDVFKSSKILLRFKE